jgi:hypothetical protein
MAERCLGKAFSYLFFLCNFLYCGIFLGYPRLDLAPSTSGEYPGAYACTEQWPFVEFNSYSSFFFRCCDRVSKYHASCSNLRVFQPSYYP